MSDTITLALVILVLPLAASLVAALSALTPLKRYAHVPLIVACGSAAVVAWRFPDVRPAAPDPKPKRRKMGQGRFARNGPRSFARG